MVFVWKSARLQNRAFRLLLGLGLYRPGVEHGTGAKDNVSQLSVFNVRILDKVCSYRIASSKTAFRLR